MGTELTDLGSHFRFGENWASFSRLINEERVEAAVRSLGELVGSELSGRDFLDIGCGSGLSSLAAARLGAKTIMATDIDPDSARTASQVLAANLAADRYAVRTISVLDMEVSEFGVFDFVHSWGVLHHTGAMWKSIERAAEFTKPGGVFVLAIYRKTPLCGFWRIEKALYSRAPTFIQKVILGLYRAAVYGSQLIRLRNPWRFAAEYRVRRGMDQAHDFHDWLGGFPYESATPAQIDDFLSARGFRLERATGTEAKIGIFGTGCAEYVYRRVAPIAVGVKSDSGQRGNI